jgi:uncharacterized protein
MSFALASVVLLWIAPSLESQPSRLVAAAKHQIGKTIGYDGNYRSIRYPGGDVAIGTGVCSDVVIRSFRVLGIDLQRSVHEDMTAAFKQYPQLWRLTKPDSNIDHRRVPNLMTYFERRGKKITASSRNEDFLPGDIVAWDLGNRVTHIGIVSDDRALLARTPLVIHNIGGGVKEEDILFKFTIIGHYRYF